MEDVIVKQESIEPLNVPNPNLAIDIIGSSGTSTSGSSESNKSDASDDAFLQRIIGKRSSSLNGDEDGDDDEGHISKKPKNELALALPVGFLDPLPKEDEYSPALVPVTIVGSCRQFWKAGDYEGGNGANSPSYSAGMDHVRVHPRFLHSNATSHKWALGAFAELLDNSLDEICYGATYVNVDMLISKRDGSKMLLVEDNGGGMYPDRMRQCMSLGYSAKSKLANTIGQYGNGFKTSTMRLGADVLVFSRCKGRDGISPTQTIGLLSYTFLRSTGKEDIVVPMVDYEKRGGYWDKLIRASPDDWDRNLQTIVQWSPYLSEAELVQQFDNVKDQGTRIIIYNLWEDDEGCLELDFDTDPHDIQIRGVNRDEKKIEMAKKYPNSSHFLTYRHSLRSYTAILYLRLPVDFRITLRGKDVDHHNLVDDMMLSEMIPYRPQPVADGMPKDPNMVTNVTIGFAKDAQDHIDIQGFNVYHKNRLIKPFWRVWNAAGSDGRGVIGVLEANFVEPAHDKQGFERTTVLQRLESRLNCMQKSYWRSNCHKIGYAPRRDQNAHKSNSSSGKDKDFNQNGHFQSHSGSRMTTKKPARQSPLAAKASEHEMNNFHCEAPLSGSSHMASPCGGTQQDHQFSRIGRMTQTSHFKGAESVGDANLETESLNMLREENFQLRERLRDLKGLPVEDLLNDLHVERDRTKSLEKKLEEADKKLQELDKEQEALISIFQEERERRDQEEENMRAKLRDASKTIGELIEKVRHLESIKISSCKIEY